MPEHDCSKCNHECHSKPTDEQVERMIEHMIIVSDVVETIKTLKDPKAKKVAKWMFLGNYLVMRGVFNE